MGLDMYLARKTHYGGLSGKQIKSMKVEEEDGKEQEIELGKYGVSVEQNVAYWRKANQIHHWFVETLGGGVDECQHIYAEREDLERLYDLCKEVKEKAKLGRGLVKIGETWTQDKNEMVIEVEPIYQGGQIVDFKVVKNRSQKDIPLGSWYRPTDEEVFYHRGKEGFNTSYTLEDDTIVNPDELAEILPTTEGFFFGTTSYDKWYLEDIDLTIEQLEKIFKEHDELVASGVKNYDIEYDYQASW